MSGFQWAAGCLAAAIFMASPALAQRGPAAGAAQAAQFGRSVGLSPLRLPPSIQSRLKLTAEQKAKLEALNQEMLRDMRAVFAAPPNGSVNQAITNVTRASDAKAIAVLDASQKAEFLEMKSEAATYQGLGRAAVALLAVDALTAAQKKQLHELARLQLARRNRILRPSTGRADAAERTANLEQLEQATLAGIRKVLTAQQFTVLSSAMNEGARQPARRAG